MRSRLLFVLAAASLLGITSAANAATVVTTLTMDRDPVEEGWLLNNEGGSHSVADSVLRIEAPSFYEFYAPTEAWVQRARNADGWTVEARVRRDPLFSSTPGMFIGDDSFVTVLGLTGSGIELGDGSAFVGSHAVDTSIFHTYKLVGLRNTLSVFVDDLLALSLDAVGPSGGTFAFGFGDNNRFTTDSLLSVAEWDYVSLTTSDPAPIPLPAGVWLLGSGILALGGVAWRRRRAV